uniref:phenylalanine--tRNA ligase n=1 Tax=Antithamnion hubbsii TaxID=1005974 RepID=A0A4D6WJX9_9FLOR|nr:Phenylalanine-tRNA ligase beta subunit [Antithamnion hubbsii]
MRFSWNSLKYFIDLQDIQFNELMNKLTLAGFEIDDINQNPNIQDTIIDLNITANRQDVSSVIGLATEISSLINKPLLINHLHLENKINQYQINSSSININKNTNLSEIRINIIHNLKNQNSPEWMKKYLLNYDIQCTDLLSDIQKYIQIKWGQEICIIDISDIYNQNLNKDLIEIKTDQQVRKINDINNIFCQEYLIYNNIKLEEIISQQLDLNKPVSAILLCGYAYDSKKSNLLKLIKNNNYINTDENQKRGHTNKRLYLDYAYQEALTLISTTTQGIINKPYYYSKINKRLSKTITINKKFIEQTLGPLKNSSTKYLKTHIITDILKRLNLNPKYNYYTKNFVITIPEYRYKDLSRNIDVIEEIGRIYGYKNFLDKLPYKYKTGFISKQYHLINQIRQIFRDVGLHEVINSSLTKTNKIIKSPNQYIKIYNPLLEDQSILRNNLIEDLIYNKEYNYKQKNRNIEIFEIGRVFNQSSLQKEDNEQIHLAGIMANNNFIQTSWKEKSHKLNWFHVKGTIEYLFEKLQIEIKWDPLNSIENKQEDELFNNCYDTNNSTYIKICNTNFIIGILGQLNNTLSKHLYDNQKMYIFEININTLKKLQIQKKHLEYTLSEYSRYPSVSRDISIQINKNIALASVKKYIYQTNPSLIENIDIFNEYYDKQKNKRYIGLRITYRSNNKTLNNNDIKHIDHTIQNILQNINK